MPDTFTKLAQVQLVTEDAVVSVYTSPVGTNTIIRHIRAVNQTTVEANVTGQAAASTALTMWVKSGSAPTVSEANRDYLILPKADISDGGWAEFEGTIIVPAGETLYAARQDSTLGTSRDITLSVYGLEMS